jgi:hypothetical protein
VPSAQDVCWSSFLGRGSRAWGSRTITRRVGPQGNGPEAEDEEPRTAPSDSRTPFPGPQKCRHQQAKPPDHRQTKVGLAPWTSLLRRNLTRPEPNMQHSTQFDEARCLLRFPCFPLTHTKTTTRPKPNAHQEHRRRACSQSSWRSTSSAGSASIASKSSPPVPCSLVTSL